MKTLREILHDADVRHVAVGHFNISELGALKGIFTGAQQLSVESGAAVGAPDGKIPILIGVSEGEREFIGVKQAVALIRSIREEYQYPIFLNADHTHTLDNVRAAAEAGFDEILFDGSALSMEENLKQTLEAVKIIRTIDATIVVEGEIGYIGASSEIIAERPTESLKLSTPEEAVRFVKETGIDVLAPAVGNMHGLLKTMVEGTAKKRLDLARIAEIKNAITAAGVSWMTLHGGSDTDDNDFKAAVAAGMTIVHVSSELRLAWRRGIEEGLAAHPDEIAPYKILPPAVEKIKEVVKGRLKLFNGLG